MLQESIKYTCILCEGPVGGCITTASDILIVSIFKTKSSTYIPCLYPETGSTLTLDYRKSLESSSIIPCAIFT